MNANLKQAAIEQGLNITTPTNQAGASSPVINVPCEDLSIGATNTLGYVNYYADINGDGQIDIDNDGLIFADLSVSKSGRYAISNVYPDYGNFSYTAIPEYNLKKYKISESPAEPEGGVGSKKFIFWDKVSNGQDRFYAVALKDLKNDSYSSLYWWKAASISTNNTALTFGSGRQNTTNIIELWNNNAYTHDPQDMWYLYSALSADIKAKWFIPSDGELSAMIINLGTYYLSGSTYWSSSLVSSPRTALACLIAQGFTIDRWIYENRSVRLITTF